MPQVLCSPVCVNTTMNDDAPSNSNETANLPLYAAHEGTMRVGGATVPRKAAWRALALLEGKVPNVEFLFIGASAGQQSLKAIGILCDLYDRKYREEYVLVFRPMRYRTLIDGTEKEVDAQVWRAYVIDLSYLCKLIPADASEPQTSSG